MCYIRDMAQSNKGNDMATHKVGDIREMKSGPPMWPYPLKVKIEGVGKGHAKDGDCVVYRVVPCDKTISWGSWGVNVNENCF